VGAKEVRDSHDGGYGVIDMQEIFEKSSNVGTAKIVYRHFSKNPVAFIESLAKLGIDRKTEIDVEGEAKPLMYHPGDGHWSGTTLPAMSYGYEVMLTPLQILNFYNAVANGGTMVKPHLVKEIRSKGVTVKKIETEVLIPKICSDSTLHVARRMLEGVVERGTASNLRNAYYRIAAKTGTTQIADNNRGYGIERKTYRASLCGYFPAADPLYSMIIVVSSPSKNVYYGNDVAGPVFREVADKVYATSTKMHKSIEKDTSSLYSYTPYNMRGAFGDFVALSKKISLDVSQVQDPIPVVKGEKKIVTSSRIPDLTGTGLRDALYALEHAGCRVTVKGKGKVISQSVPPGQVVQKGTHITIKLG
jgi:cell division protein FtsI (penicillin-binding protein 3)